MATWYLCFNHPDFVSLQTFERFAAAVLGGPGTLELGEISGNPRDFYDRSVEVRGERDGMQLRFSTSQGMRSPSDPEPRISHVNVTIASETAPFATKLAIWTRVQEVLASLGFTEHTLTNGGSEIIDEAKAAGEVATAKRLGDTKRGKLIEQATHIAHVNLISPRTDIEPILAAFPRPENILSMSLKDCRITELPKSFFRFPNVRTLYLEEDALDGRNLRGVSLPQLEWLTFRGAGVRSIAADDLAGFPALETLSVTDCWLASLDPRIVEVCPKLIRVYIEYTPLWRDHEAELRARWPHILWRYDDGYERGKRSSAGHLIATRAPPSPPPFERRQAPSELRPFFDKIIAAPDDDAPRLELADYLIARGDKRGEQIRNACELAKVEMDDPNYLELRERTTRLPEFVFFSDTSYPFLGLYQARRRGFMEHIECSDLDWMQYGEELLRDAPIQRLTLRTAGAPKEFAKCPTLAALRELRFEWIEAEARAVILRSPHLANTLQRVAVGALDSAADVETLAAELRPLAKLTELELRGTLMPDAVPPLVALVKSRQLLRLHVDYCTMKPTSLIEQLWDELGDVVRPRRVPRVPFKDGVLELWEAKYSLEQIRALVATGHYRTTKRLSLSCARNGQEVATWLATCGAFPELVELSLGWASDTSARALATKATGLDRLESIFLGEIKDGQPYVSDAGVLQLAQSKRLPALRTIERSQTHNVYASDARDDSEVVEIPRADGTTVKSIIGHCLWP